MIMNEVIGSVEYDGLINSAYPADVIHASLASGNGVLKRGCVIAHDVSGNLIPWGSDITDDLVAVLDVANHEAVKTQAGLRTANLRVFALDLVETTLAVDDTEHTATLTLAGLDEETLVVKSEDNVLTENTDYTADYTDGVLTITLLEGGGYYAVTSLDIKCFYEDKFVEIAEVDEEEECGDYAFTYSTNTLTISLDDASAYYDTPKVKILCPYTYSEGSIAGAAYILAEDVDTGIAGGGTVVARVYRTGVFSRNKLLHDPKALDGIGDVTKEKLRSLGILLNDAFN